MDRRPRRVAVALGSNVGDRVAHLAHAVDRLRTLLADVVVSTFIETVPDHDPDDPLFLNGALVGTTEDTPERLLVTLLAIERERGRERHHAGAPRTLGYWSRCSRSNASAGESDTTPARRARSTSIWCWSEI